MARTEVVSTTKKMLVRKVGLGELTNQVNDQARNGLAPKVKPFGVRLGTEHPAIPASLVGRESIGTNTNNFRDA